jgi:YesN/AraC family two-component response regulator
MTMPETPVISGGDSVEVQTTDSSPVESSSTSFIDPETIYSKLPDQFKEAKLLDEVLSGYNEQYKTQLSEATSKYAGLDAFVDVDPQQLAVANQIYDMLQDPETARQVYDQLGSAYGFTQAQMQQAVQQQVAPQEESQEIPDEDLTPEQLEIKQLRQTVEQMQSVQTNQQEHYQQQLQLEHQAGYESEIDSALKTVFTNDPSLQQDEIRFKDLMTRVSNLEYSDRAGGKTRPFNQLVNEAHQEQKAYNQYLYDTFGKQGQSNNGSSPLVMAPSGTTPAPQTDYTKMDQTQLRDAAVNKLLEAMNQ